MSVPSPYHLSRTLVLHSLTHCCYSVQCQDKDRFYACHLHILPLVRYDRAVKYNNSSNLNLIPSGITCFVPAYAVHKCRKHLFLVCLAMLCNTQSHHRGVGSYQSAGSVMPSQRERAMHVYEEVAMSFLNVMVR